MRTISAKFKSNCDYIDLPLNYPRIRLFRRFPIAKSLLLLSPLLLSAEAWARLGGGEGYSGGSSSSSSSGGSYSGGGDGGGLIRLLLWLLIYHPSIGVPLTIGVVVFFVWSKRQRGSSERVRTRSHRRAQPVAPEGRAPALVDGLSQLRRDDPGFSEPLFLDLVQLVYARGQHLRGPDKRAAIEPYFSASALSTMTAGGGAEVRDIIFGATRIQQAQSGGGYNLLTVYFDTNFTESASGGASAQLLSRELWRFRRKTGVTSPGPERMRALSCPSCGSSAEIRADGRCPSCESVRTGGATQWEVTSVEIQSRRRLEAPELHLGGGEEPGTQLPTVVDPELGRQRRAFEARHPDHDWSAFRRLVQDMFSKLQGAWASGRWEDARPHETDSLFQVHRFWIERYRLLGLKNRLENLEINGVELARIDVDAYYESITVRVRASMCDWTESADGRVVAGSQRDPRVFTEYWTLIRTIGGKKKTGRPNLAACPSCGAPLDRVSMVGVCGYCDSKITTGEHDWVLSRIEQDDVYAG